MHPENGRIVVHKGICIEIFILILRTVLCRFEIKGADRVQRRVFAVALVTEIDVIRHKRAVFTDKRFYLFFAQEFLLFVGNVHYYLCAAVLLFAVVDSICGISVRCPFYRRFSVLIGLSFDLHKRGNHIRGIKAETEVTDYAVAARLFVFRKEIVCARKSYLGNILFYFVGAHSNAVVLYGQRSGVFIHRNFDAVFFTVGFRRLAHRYELFKLGNRVYTVCDNLP